jgi:hypothetical protein
MFLVRCSFIFILFFLINFFITSSFAANGRNYNSGGTFTITNDTTLTGDYAIYGDGNKDLTVTNNGTLSATADDGMWNCCLGTTTFINNGRITAVRNGIGQMEVLDLSNEGSSKPGSSPSSFTNNGSINVTGTTTGQGVGFYSWGGTGTYVNTGTITGREGMILEEGNYVIRNTGVITTSVVDLKISSGTVTSLTNSEGGNNVLTYSGKLPTNYYIIISSLNNYGKLSVTNPTDSMTFNIDNTSSVALNSTYSSVLQGSITLSNTQGTYGGYRWNLVRNGSDYDLIITASRLAYNEIVTTIKLVNTATQLEAIRTNGTKSTLTNTLDNLSAAQLESAVKKIQGTTTVKVAAQSVQAQSSFKTALSTVTSPGSSSSMTNVTKTNQGNLTFADLQKNNLYAKIQPANYSDDSAFFDYKNNQAPVNALEFFKSNRNLNLVEKDDLKESGIFLRTFGSVTNYAAINSDDNSYGSDSYGLLGGFQHKIDENLYQGYSLGFSKSKLTLDAGEGNTKTNTIHANVYRKMDEKEYGATASLGGYVSFIDNVRNISETSEILKSSPTNGGLDFSLQYVKKMDLFGLNFYPSASLTTTYGIVKNYKETGGSGSALEIKSHNVLAIKPEIGFTLENNFVQTDKITEGANFSLFANRQQYLDGHTNTSSIIDENSWSASTLPKTKDDFLTAGIGYVAKNIEEKSDLNFNFFYTQSTNNSLNSSLFSISYNKTF